MDLLLLNISRPRKILAHTHIKKVLSVYRYQKIFIYTLSLVDSIEIRGEKVN